MSNDRTSVRWVLHPLMTLLHSEKEMITYMEVVKERQTYHRSLEGKRKRSDCIS